MTRMHIPRRLPLCVNEVQEVDVRWISLHPMIFASSSNSAMRTANCEVP